MESVAEADALAPAPSRAVAAAAVYRPEIDGLRAFAVLAVIVNHFDRTLLPNGHLGVDIFFVISGYVITSSLACTREGSLREFLVAFYARRVKRLLPALCACVLITGLAISLVSTSPATSLMTGLASLFGVSNLYLLRQDLDYFGQAASLNTFTHTWSLGVEEQFYLAFPLALWLTGFGRSSRGSSSFVFAVGLVTIASLVLFLTLDDEMRGLAFYMMPTRLWELGAGSLTFALAADARALPPFLRRIPSLPIVVAMAAVLATPGHLMGTTVGIVASSALCIVALRRGTWGYRILASPPVVHVGLISYSLYLWHWSVISLAHWTIGIHAWSAPLLAAAMFVLAELSYRRIEVPFRRATWSPSRARTVARGFCASAVTGVALLGLLAADGRLYTGTPARMAEKGVASLAHDYVLADGSSWDGARCILVKGGEVGKTLPIEGCTLGQFDGAAHRVLVVGNSFSASFVQAFDELVLRDGYAVTITSSLGALPVPQSVDPAARRRTSQHYWGEVVPGLVSKLRRGDWVFVAADLADLSAERRTPASDAYLGRFTAGIDAMASSLAVQGIRLAVLDANPFMREASCTPDLAVRQWFAPFGGPCRYLSRAATLARRARVHAALESLQGRRKIVLIDLMPLFCPGDRCTFEAANGQLLYRDEWSHPSVEAARLAAPILRRALTAGKADVAHGM